MDINNLEQRVKELQARPLQLLCRTPMGSECIMSIQECRESGSTYIHLVGFDDLDGLLGRELGRDYEEL